MQSIECIRRNLLVNVPYLIGCCMIWAPSALKSKLKHLCLWFVFSPVTFGQESSPYPIERKTTIAGDTDPFSELPLYKLPVSNSNPVQLTTIAQLDPNGPGKECSGIVRGRNWKNTYWTINDSGDEPRLYAIDGKGVNYLKSRSDNTTGVLLGGAINVDWEDIAVDDSGNVIVCDVGNNRNDRRDLTLYIVPEPSPVASRASVPHKRLLRYPDQDRFPASEKDFNFDCEGVFTIADDIYLVSKHRAGEEARIYKLPGTNTVQSVGPAEMLEPFARLVPSGQVTGADASPDGLQLVLCTYDQIWLFGRNSVNQSWFEGSLSHGRFLSPQIESICFDEKGDGLVLADEKTGQLLHLPTNALTVVRPNSSEGSAGRVSAAQESSNLAPTDENVDLWGDEDVLTGVSASLPTVDDMEAISPGAWTMVVLPDTQYYVDLTRKIPASPEVFRSMSQWIAEQRKARNIRLVLHVGDIVDNNDPAEFQMAVDALSPLRGLLPTIVCTGNHEYEGNSRVRKTYFNDFFRPATDPLIDPAKDGLLRETFIADSIENAAYEFLAPDGRPLLILSLEWGVRDEVLEWATDVAGRPKYKDHTAILLNHAYLYHDDSRYDFATKGRSQSANPLRYGTAATGDNNDGQMVWDKLVRRYSNFEMVFCGHVSGHMPERMALGAAPEVGYLCSPGDAGNRVHQLLFNAQRRGDAGDGWLRLLEFQPDGRTVVVKTYSPYRDTKGLYCWRTDSDDFFKFQLDPRRRHSPRSCNCSLGRFVRPRNSRSAVFSSFYRGFR